MSVKYIGVCTPHQRFRSSSHRWLDMSEDYKPYKESLGSIGIVEMEEPCDKCEDPNQIKIEFENVRPESEYKEVYDKVLESGMFWEFHPEMTGKWELDKQAFIDYHTD